MRERAYHRSQRELGAAGGADPGNLRLKRGDLRGFLEIVQCRDAPDNRRERGGNLWIARISPVLPPVYDVFVNFCMESLLHLSSSARKLDQVPGIRNMSNRESLRLKPAGDLLNVGVGSSELLAVLLRREPFVVLRRTFRLLALQELRQSLLPVSAGN